MVEGGGEVGKLAEDGGHGHAGDDEDAEGEEDEDEVSGDADWGDEAEVAYHERGGAEGGGHGEAEGFGDFPAEPEPCFLARRVEFCWEEGVWFVERAEGREDGLVEGGHGEEDAEGECEARLEEIGGVGAEEEDGGGAETAEERAFAVPERTG